MLGPRPDGRQDRTKAGLTAASVPASGRGVVVHCPMRVVLQRVTRASVTVDRVGERAGEREVDGDVGPEVVGAIGRGIVALVGAGHGDDEGTVDWIVRKTLDLRIFADDQGRMGRSLLEVGGALLVVSQFTLLGDCRKGRRPSFAAAMEPTRAEALYERFVACARQAGVEVATGRFGAMMDVALVNDGPVTLLLDSERRF